MNDYIRRTAKFIFYMVIIFFIVLYVFPLITGGITPKVTFTEIMRNQKFVILMAVLLAYSFVYPLIAFTNLKRHLNGSFAENRDVFEKAFDTLQYIKTEETPEKIVYRRKSQFARFVQWYEDSVVIFPNENPVIISGMRKAVTRIDRLIDQFLIKASQ